MTPELAGSVQTVAAVIYRIALSLSTLPLDMMEKRSDGRFAAPDHPIADLLDDVTNDEQTAPEFRFSWWWDFELWNAAYAEIIPGPRGAVDTLERLDPEYVKPFRAPDRQLWFEIRAHNGRPRRVLHHTEVMSMRRPPYRSDGITPIPMWELASDTLAKAISIVRYSGSFFRNSGMGGGLIFPDIPPKNEEQYAKFLDIFRKDRTGFNAHREFVFPFKATFHSTSVKHNEAQFLETAREVKFEIVQLWGLPPHAVGLLDKATFTNIEQQAIDLVTQAYQPRCVLFEKTISRDLIVARRRFYAKHNLDPVRYGDLKSRYEAWAIAFHAGWLSVNDIRRMDDKNPVPGGDVYGFPLNMIPAGKGKPGRNGTQNRGSGDRRSRVSLESGTPPDTKRRQQSPSIAAKLIAP
ncbi:phage portal protein [Caulobacter sp. ErkDOM-E]|uniref:phage portal protein n=1 Tax=Caulobacter sp. ErkDOM-E TaxID=3402778 RepID=UPI003AF80C64